MTGSNNETLDDILGAAYWFTPASPHRPGGHQIDIADYNAVMDFADKNVRGLNVTRTFNNVPYPPSTAAIPWTIPTGGGPTTPPVTTPPTTPPPTSQPVGACSASYRTVNSWQGGYQGEVTSPATPALTCTSP